MKLIHIVALALIAAGTGGLVYGEFTYAKETHEAEIGPISLTIEERETVNVPRWAGIGGVVAGAGLLLFASVKR